MILARGYCIGLSSLSRALKLCNSIQQRHLCMDSIAYNYSSICCRTLFTTSTVRLPGEFEWKDPKSESEVVNVTYVRRDGSEVNIRGKVGDNLMYLAHRYGIEMEGACEGSLACSTCHVYVQDEYFDKLDEPLEDEDDMLDQAPFVKANSRLGCQIILSKDLEGLKCTLPAVTRNFYVDGHVPEPH